MLFRSAFKLREIDDRDRLLRRGGRVVDLGAAPGGWSQVAAERCGAEARIVAIDLLPVAPISGVVILQADFLADESASRLQAALGGKADLVLSDLAPNISGIALVDQARMLELLEQAAFFARSVLAPGGAFLAKVFHGSSFDDIRRTLREGFGSVAVRKPQASRGESTETYLLARDPKPLGPGEERS